MKCIGVRWISFLSSKLFFEWSLWAQRKFNFLSTSWTIHSTPHTNSGVTRFLCNSSKLLFHAQYFMLYNSMFDDKCSDHIVSLMSQLSLSHFNSHTHTGIFTLEWACMSTHTNANAHWGVEWWMGLSTAHIYISQHCTASFGVGRHGEEQADVRIHKFLSLVSNEYSCKKCIKWLSQFGLYESQWSLHSPFHCSNSYCWCTLFLEPILWLLEYYTAVAKQCTWGDAVPRYFQ